MLTKSIDNFNGYYIRDDGSVISYKKNSGELDSKYHKIKGRVATNGYLYFIARNNQGIKKTLKFHRLVARYFVPNKDYKKKYVDHINNIKTDNRASNLQWVSPLENTQKAINDGLITNSKGISSFNNNHFEKHFASIKLCSQYYNIPAPTISNVCAGRQKIARGKYTFKLD